MRRKNSMARFIGTGIYSGYSPAAPGTAGTAVAALIYIFLKWFGFIELATPFTYILFVIWIIIIGVWSAGVLEKEVSKKDPSIVVIDEVAGYFISVAFLPYTIYTIVGAFIVFRVFDVLKPFPANISQKLKGGYGIMADDIIAGIYSCIILHVLNYIF